MKSLFKFILLTLVAEASLLATSVCNIGFVAEAQAQQSPALAITRSGSNQVSESGQSQTFSVALRTAPESKVIINVAVSDGTEAKVDKTQLTFMRENWSVPQSVTVTGLDDSEADGDIKFKVTLSLSYTKANSYLSLRPESLDFVCIDNDGSGRGGYPSRGNNTNNTNTNNTNKNSGVSKPNNVVRIMTANTTSGNSQSYDPGDGVNIFKAMKPDIVLIQEFNYKSSSIGDFVKSTFGSNYTYHRGSGGIPNGIISRYPIISKGGWPSNIEKLRDRQWEWAVIDVPGNKDLLAVSLHLHTKENATEMQPLVEAIKNKIAQDHKEYYLIIGGDFNQNSLEVVRNGLGSLVVVPTSPSDSPVDQEGDAKTNATRKKRLDYLLCSPELCRLEKSIKIGTHTYSHGHVIDSRVYDRLGELSVVPPMEDNDSNAANMQHMAIIRDFAIK